MRSLGCEFDVLKTIGGDVAAQVMPFAANTGFAQSSGGEAAAQVGVLLNVQTQL